MFFLNKVYKSLDVKKNVIPIGLGVTVQNHLLDSGHQRNLTVTRLPYHEITITYIHEGQSSIPLFKTRKSMGKKTKLG